MTQLGIQPPQPLELVGGPQADEIIAATERELVELQRAADAAEHAADDAEADARAGGADLDASPWALVRMQTFIDGLRAEVARDVETMLSTARRHAGVQLPDAVVAERTIDLTAPTILAPTALRTPPEVAPDIEPVEVTRAAAALLAEPLVPPATEPPSIETPVVADVAPVEAAEPDPPVALASEPAPVAPVVADAVASAPVVDEQILFTPPQRVEPVAPEPSVVFTTPPPPPAPVVADVVANDPTVPEAKRRRAKRGKGRGFPISTVLEVLAVVLVLVFILLRLG